LTFLSFDKEVDLVTTATPIFPSLKKGYLLLSTNFLYFLYFPFYPYIHKLYFFII